MSAQVSERVRVGDWLVDIVEDADGRLTVYASKGVGIVVAEEAATVPLAVGAARFSQH